MRFVLTNGLVLPWICSREVIKILLLSKKQQNHCIDYYYFHKAIPWDNYSGLSRYDAVRDHLILQVIKENYENSSRVNLAMIENLVGLMGLTRLIQQTTPSTNDWHEQKFSIWNRLLESVETYNQRVEEDSIKKNQRKINSMEIYARTA